jgi:hypothetical protein
MAQEYEQALALATFKDLKHGELTAAQNTIDKTKQEQQQFVLGQ